MGRYAIEVLSDRNTCNLVGRDDQFGCGYWNMGGVYVEAAEEVSGYE